MGDAEREGLSGSLEEGDRVSGIFGVVDVEMDEAGAAIDSDIEEAFTSFSVRGTQLGQMLYVDVDKAEIIVLEASLPLEGLRRRLGGRRLSPSALSTR